MQQVTNISVDKLPDIGYYSSPEEKKEKFNKNETHIHKQGPLTGAKVTAHKITNDILTYYPKGFSGSKNSNFYEYLSMGIVPYILGSVNLIALYGVANRFFNASDRAAAAKPLKSVGAGVVFYAVGKWLHQKLAHAALNASTSINLDKKYINKKIELPEPGQEKGMVRTEYPGIYDSAQFYRSDLLAKDGEMNHNNLYYHDDKVVKKAGFKDKMNASNQTASDKIRKLKVRTTALENIGKYIMAATGVALGSQKAFENLRLKKPSTIPKTIKQGITELWQGTNRNKLTKHYGKALLIGSAVSALMTWLIPTIAFKHNADTVKSKVDTNKEYEVC